MKPESDNFREGNWLLDLAIMSFLVLGACCATMAGCLKSASAVEIPLEARTPNVGNYCTWCSIATLAKTHRVDRLRSVARDRWTARQGASDPGYMATVRAELDSRGVRYLAENDGVRNGKTLERYAASHGVVVTIVAGNGHANYVATDGQTYSGCHSILLTHYDAERVEFWDSSKPIDRLTKEPKTWKASREWFDRYWSGNTIVIFPDEQVAAQ